MSHFDFLLFKRAMLVVFAFILLTLTSTYANNIQKQKASDILGYSTQLFASDLFTKLDEGNQLFSPVLIQSGLALLPVQGSAKKQLINVLRLSNRDNWANLYKNFMISVHHNKEIDVQATSAIFVKNKVQFLKAYKKLLKKYGTMLQSVDFTKPDIVANQINQWVKAKTNNKIQEIVDASSVTSATAALLVSVLYFRAEWEKPFLEEATYPSAFYSNGKQERKTPMMQQTSTFNYAENQELDAKFLELPYKSNDFSMTIVLPNQRDGLQNLENQISKIFEVQNLTMSQTFVKLPKFKFENKIELTNILRKLGLTTLLNDGVSFGNSNAEKLKINNVLQKTFVEVNEFGTEAAAVMEVEMTSRFGFADSKSFEADHPFLFFIRQESSGVVLFLGRFTNPE